MRNTAIEILVDLVATDPIERRTFGQGSFGHGCRFCPATDYAGPLAHEPNCVWLRARDFVVQPQIDTVNWPGPTETEPWRLIGERAVVLTKSGRAEVGAEFDLPFKAVTWTETHRYRVRLDRVLGSLPITGGLDSLDRWDAVVLADLGVQP